MKRNVFFLSALLFSGVAAAQVGVNLANPLTTFDIKAKNEIGFSTNVDGIRIPQVDRLRAQNMQNIPKSTLVYINSITTGSQLDNAMYIDDVGFYYYDGNVWMKLNPSTTGRDEDNNIYNTDGTLQSNRVVYQGDKALIFNSNTENAFSIQGTKKNIFSVNYNTFSVDAQNDRVGIGTINPSGKVDIISDNVGHGEANDFYFRGFGSSAYPAFFITSANGTYNTPENLVNEDEIGSLRFIPRANNNYVYSEGTKLTGFYKGDGMTGKTDLRITTSGAERMRIDETGKVGIGTIAPTHTLHVNADADPLRLQGIQEGNIQKDKLMLVQDDGTVKRANTIYDILSSINVPTPAFFRLPADIYNFLNGVPAGSKVNTPMTLIKNSILGLSYNGTSITIPPGTYQITYVYEGAHNISGCTVSSYFIDFPIAGGTKRIHSTAAHNDGATSNHGGTISFTTQLPTTTLWNIHLGRGQSGNCSGTGNTLKEISTHLLIYRLGDAAGDSTDPGTGSIQTITCGSATNTGTLTNGIPASGVTSSIPYTGGNGGIHNGQIVSSTGVTGLTATLSSGSFTSANGTLVYTITGTPSASGTANFAINIGGKTCTLSRTVVINTSLGVITGTLNCASASNSGTLTAGTSASGVSSSIPYTSGNGGVYNSQTISSTGVTGLTATLSAGSFVNGNGNLVYTITGTPSAAGTASFAINIGGKTCVLTRTVNSAVGAITGAISCASRTVNGTLKSAVPASGVSVVIPYTGGNGGSHSGQTVTSTGITGLTAKLVAGNFINGSGSLTYIITGTGLGVGNANFAINIGGKTCTVSVPVESSEFKCTSAGVFPDPNDPDSYYRCTSTNIAYHYNCPGGSTFNPGTLKCTMK